MPETTFIDATCGGRPLSFECFDTDFSRGICRGILNGETYKSVPFIRNVSAVADIGANVGAASVYFASVYPLAEIFAFEPDPTSFAVLKRNTEGCERIHPANFGLFNTDCSKILYNSQIDSVTASIRSSCLNSNTGQKVKLQDAYATLAGMPHPEVVKIDTEGCEVPILYSALEIIAQAKVIYVELHSELDRKITDCLLGSTHIIFLGGVSSPHRGEFCYVRRDAAGDSNELTRLEIR